MSTPPTGPPPETLLALLVELDRVRAVALDLLDRSTAPLLAAPPTETDDGSDPDGTRSLHDLLAGARRAVLGHPAAAKAMHDLLVAEGHRYAQTPEGARLRDALAASEAVAHLRRIWETVSLNVLDGPAAPSNVPDAWAEALSDAITGRVLGENAGPDGTGPDGTGPAATVDTVLARLRPEGFA